MGSRLDLHALLVSIVNPPQEPVEGEEPEVLPDRVYFQPPASIAMDYPCVRYSIAKFEADHANNIKYANKTRYQVTVIYKDPDSPLPRAIFALPLCSHDRHFVQDGLYHDTFDLYY